MPEEGNMASRPFGITLIGYLSSIAGVLAFIVGIGLLGLSLTRPFLAIIWGPIGVLLAVLVLLAGILDMSIGYAVLERKSWGWWAAFAVNMVYLLVLLGFVSIFPGPVFLGVIVKTIVILFYLSTRPVRVFFGMALRHK